MAIHPTDKGVYGPGTFTDKTFAPLPQECQRLLKYFAETSPGFTTDKSLLDNVEFHGSDLPIIPGPLKSQAFSSVLQAMIGLVGKEISALKGVDTGKIKIDVDKCGLYPATVSIVTVDGEGFGTLVKDGAITKVGVDLDHGVLQKNDMHYRSWAIYPTKDKHVWYQIMGNLDPPGLFRAYGLDPDARTSSRDEAYEIIKAEISKYSAAELEQKNMEHGLCGQTCFTPEHWRQILIGKSLARHPIINYQRVKEKPDLPPVPFPKVPNDYRPLAGIKVIELARVIAGPAMGAALSSLGAEVIKVQSPNLPDLQPLSLSLTAGKHTYPLDLTRDEDKKKLHRLMEGADVIIQAFRLRSLERKGFGLNDVLEMANKRGKGIVYIDLNCYGPDGYYAERPGFQQIADAASGCSYVCGKAYGFEEGVSVLPPLPIADMLSGAAGVVDAMLALRDRAKYGGSYHATVSLTAIDAIQLVEEVGLLQPNTVKKIQDTFKFAPMTPDLHVEELLVILMEAWAKNSDILTRKGYKESFETDWAKHHEILSPIIKYENDKVSPQWTHGPVPYCTHKVTSWSS